MCGSGEDDVYHRAWECPCTADLRELLPRRIMILAKARGARDSALYTRGLIPHPAEEVDPPAHPFNGETGDGYQVWRTQEIAERHGEEIKLSGRIFVDGSCTTHPVAELRRAA